MPNGIPWLAMARKAENELACRLVLRQCRSMQTAGSELLRRWRERKGLSQETAAEKLGVRQATLSRYESGARAPRLPEALRIRDVAGVPLEAWGDQ